MSEPAPTPSTDPPSTDPPSTDPPSTDPPSTTDLPAALSLPEDVAVVNVGLAGFADALRAQDRPVAHVDWRPPAGGDPDAVRALTVLHGRRADAIEAANAEVVRRLDTATPRLVGVAPAGEVVPGLAGRTLMHCGTALGWEQVCDPLRRSMRAAVVAEDWAPDAAAAEAMLAAGEVRLSPAHDHDTVVPMASAVGPAAPVLVVEHDGDGDRAVRAFAPINQGPGDAPWFGRDTAGAIGRLRLLRETVGPALSAIVTATGPVDLLALAGQGIAMGDDLHMRTQAATNLLARSWLGHVADLPDDLRRGFAEFLAGNHLFFLTPAMAAAKSLTLWAQEVTGSTMVTSMARNGTSFGIRVAGSTRWFVTEAPAVAEALYQPGHGPEDAAPDIGDSAVLELVGLGGAAAANSPAVAAFLGGTMDDAAEATTAFRRICAGASSRFTLPVLGFAGTPLGIDLRRVVESGITPKVNTGILDARSGGGQVGAGVATAPMACFREALLALAGR